MPKEPFNKGEAVTRQQVVHVKRLICEEIMFRGPEAGQIFSSGGANIVLSPEGDGGVFVRETEIGVTGGQTNTVAGANGITNIGDNIAAILAPTFGSSSDTICEGDDPRLSSGVDNATVRVSPAFTASDPLNQYPTIAQALARADVLVTDPAIERVGVEVLPGDYPEEGLYVRNDVILNLLPGARIIGPPVPTPTYPEVTPTDAALIVVQGSGRLAGVYIRPQNTAAVSGSLVIIDSGVYQPFIERVAIDIASGAENWDNGILIKEQPAFATFEDLYDQLVTINGMSVAWVVFDGAGAPVGSLSSSLIKMEGSAVLMLLGFTSNALFAKNVIEMEDNETAGTGGILFMANSYLNNTWWSGFVPVPGPQIQNTSTGVQNYRGSILASNSGVDPTLCDVGVNKITLTNANSVEQTVYPDPTFGTSDGTVQFALETIKDDTDRIETTTNRNHDNIAVLATAAAFAEGVGHGDFSGMVQDAYSNDDDIDPSKSHGYEVRDGHLVFESKTIDEDFESYADTTALRVVWVPNDTGNTPANLLVEGTNKLLEITFNQQSDNDEVKQTFAPALDMTDVLNRIQFRIRGTGSSGSVLFYLEFIDGNGSTATRRVNVGTAATMTDVLLASTDFTFVFAGGADHFRWWDVTDVRWFFGSVNTTGSFVIDDIITWTNSEWIQDGLIEDWNTAPDLANWTLSVGTKNLLGAPLSWDGVGALGISNLNQGQTFTLSRTLGAPLSLGAEPVALRVWAAVVNESSGTGWSVFRLKLTDGSANVLQMVGVPQRWDYDAAWFPVYFLIEDGVEDETTAPAAFDLTDITAIELSTDAQGANLSGGPPAYLKLANLEYGRPPIVYATNYADADDLDQAKVNAVYNQPWTEALSLPPYVRWAITVASGAAWKPIDGTGKLTGMRGALQPYGSSVNWPLLGEWKDIEQKIGGFNMKHRVVQTRPGQNYYSLPGRGTVYVDGLSIIWRLLTP